MRTLRLAVALLLFAAAAYANNPGSFSWTAAGQYPNENDGSTTITMVRLGGTAGTVTIDYATSNGTALAGVHFVATSGTITFHDGEAVKSVSIPIIDNNTWDGGAKVFTVVMSNPTGGASMSSIPFMFVDISDDEPRPTLSINDVTVTEGNSGTVDAVFTVTISGARSIPVSFDWSAAGDTASSGIDFVNGHGSHTFAPSDTQTTIRVAVIGDVLYEPDETFVVFISANLNMAKRSGVCTILNDDPKPVIAAGNVSVTEGDSGRKSVNLALTANQPISGWVDVRTVDGTAIAGRDYDAFSSSTFWNGETQRQVALQIIGNTAVEPDKQFTVHVSTLANGGITVVNPDATVTVLNDDQGLGPATQNVPKGSTAAVLLDAGTAPPSPQTIAVAVSDPCIQAPPSVTLSARSVAIPVAALTGPCSANVTVTLPAALGGKKYSAGIRTYNPVTVTFDPPSPQLYLGQTLNVHVDVSPLDAPIVLPLVAVGDTVEVPASVSVDAHGGSFTVKGMRQGALTVVATLPPQNGNLTAALAGSVAAAPATVTIFQLAPPSGPVAGGTAVTLTGVNFRADCTFGFGGVPATNVAVHDATSTTVTAPAHVAGSVDVTASCGAQSYTLRNGFTYVAGSAAISSVAPSSGAVDGGTLVRITGSDFVPSCWAFFGGTAAHNVSVIGTTEVIASTPAHAAGAVAVSLRCGQGNEPALGGAFNYSAAGEPAPVITSVSPLAAAPGQAVTIDGSRFRLSDTVTFGSVAAQVVGSAPDGHVVLVPTMPAGNVSVNVDDGNGHLSTTGPIFSVLQPLLLRVLQVTPMTVPAGGEIELVWSGFRDPYTFALGTAPLRLRKHSTTSGVAEVPAALAPGRYMLRVADGTGAMFDAALVLTVTDSGTVVAGVAPVCATTGAGTAISITGRGFAAGAIVTVNGVPAANVAVVDAAHINATLPALAPGLATVAVDGATLTNALRIYSPFDPDGCGTAPRPRPARR